METENNPEIQKENRKFRGRVEMILTVSAGFLNNAPPDYLCGEKKAFERIRKNVIKYFQEHPDEDIKVSIGLIEDYLEKIDQAYAKRLN